MFPPARPELRKAEPTITSPSSSAIFQPFATLNYNDSVDGGSSNIVYRQPSRALYCIISERRASVCFPIEYPTVGTANALYACAPVAFPFPRATHTPRANIFIHVHSVFFCVYVCACVCEPRNHLQKTILRMTSIPFFCVSLCWR